MIDINELRRLTQAVSEWSCCNQAWLDQSEDVPAAVVWHIDEDGNTYPVATIDCDQYCAGHQSLPLAKFYAAANPAAITELLDRLEAAESDGLEQARLNGMGGEREAALLSKLEAAEKERDALRAKIEQMEKQEVFVWYDDDSGDTFTIGSINDGIDTGDSLRPLYALPGAQPAPNIPPRIEPNGMYDGNHHYASGWNDCRAEMLEAQPEAKP